MSTVVDQRVVEMEFDNKRFEQNVSTTMSTLEKLKQSLNLTGAAKGLESVGAAAKGINLSGLGTAAETVTTKFSYMQMTIQHQLNQIVDGAIAAGKRIISALTIDPVKTGFSEYETLINATQTILANTQSKGSTIDDVNKALEELNKYADLTIYNFTEMTRNIGTFTAAGIDLNTSVNAIQGIANLAAVSGSTSQQASTAMYQLSQALSSGTVRLMDWNSVVNAGMGGQMFQDALKKTSELLGTGAEAAIKAEGSFRESLKTGWLTSEVLTETLKTFTTSGANEYVAEYTGLSKEAVAAALDEAKARYGEADAIKEASKALAEKSGKNANEIESALQFAKNAEDAATKVKTFTQLWDVMREAAQSGWSKTWKLIVGDFEQAKGLLTPLADFFTGVINKMSDARNNLLESALGTKITSFVDGISKATRPIAKTVDTVKDLGEVVNKVINGGFGEGEERFDALTKAGYNYYEIQNKVNEQLGLSFRYTDEQIKSQDKLLGIQDKAVATHGKLSDAQKKELIRLAGMTDAQNEQAEATADQVKELRALQEQADKVGLPLDEFIEKMDEIDGRWLLIEGLKNVGESIMSVFKTIGQAWENIFPPKSEEERAKGLFDILANFHRVTENISKALDFSSNTKTIDEIRRVFEGVFAAVDVAATVIKAVVGGFFDLLGMVAPVGGGILTMAANLGDWIVNLRDAVEETDIFGESIDKVVTFVGNIVDKIKEFGNAVKDAFQGADFSGYLNFFQGLWNVISWIGDKVGSAFSAIGEGLAQAFTGESSFMDILNTGLFAGILAGINKFIWGLSDPFESIGGIFEQITDVLDGVRGCFEAYQNQLKAGTLMTIASAIAILAAAILVVAMIDPVALDRSLGAITVLFVELIGALAAFTKVSSNMKGVVSACTAMISISIAVLLLANALKTMESLDATSILNGVLAIGLLMTELGVFLQYAKLDGTMTGTAVGLVILSSAMLILAKAVEDFGAMDWDQIGKGLVAIGGLLGLVGVFSHLASGAQHVVSTGVAMVLLGASMKIFASAIKDFGNMDWDQIGRGLTAMGGALAIVAVAMNFMPYDMLSLSVGMVLVGGALKIIASAMSDFGGMSWEEIGKGLVTIGGALAIVALGLNFMTGTLAGSAALLVATGALALMVPVFKSLGSMSWEEIGKGLIVVAGAFAVIGVAGLLLTPVIPAILSLAGALIAFGVAAIGIGIGVAAIAAAFTALSTAGAAGATAIVAALSVIVTGVLGLIPEIIRGLGEIIVSVCDVIIECAPRIADTILVVLAEVLTSLAKYTPQIVSGLFEFVIGLLDGLTAYMPQLIQSAMNVIGAFFRGIVDAIKGIDTTALFEGIIGVGLLSGLMLALSAVAGLIPGAMLGVLGMGAVIAELALVLAAIGALAQIPGLKWLIEEGGDFMQSIGTAIGQFVGGIVAGVAEGATSTLPTIGENLSGFMENAQTFIDGASAIDETMLAGVEALAGAILTLTGAGLLDTIASWLGGGNSLADFGEQLVPFGTAMKNYSEEVAGIDMDAVNGSVAAAEKLVEIANTLPDDGLFGTDGIDDFGKNIVTFGKSMKDYSNAVTGIDTTAVNTSVAAAEGLVKVANAIPDDGLFGTDGIDNFGDNIVSFAKSLKKYGDNAAEISIDAVNGSIAASNLLMNMINRLTTVNTSGISGFADAIDELCTVDIKGFVSTFKGLSTELVSAGSNLVEMLAKGMESKGNTLGIIATNIINSAFMKVKSAGVTFQVAGIELLSRFISGVSSQTARAVRVFENMMKNASTAISGYTKAFYNVGANLVAGFANGISANTYKATARAKAMAAAAASAAKKELDEHSPSKVGYEIGDFFGVAFVTAISDYTGKAYDTSAAMADSAKNGLGNAIAKIQDFVEGNLDTQPTIRPILDLSDVQAGVNSMGGMLNMGASVGVMANVGAISSMMNSRHQNVGNGDVVSAIDKLSKRLDNIGNTTYQVNGVTYDDGSNVSTAVRDLVRAARIERRV